MKGVEMKITFVRGILFLLMTVSLCGCMSTQGSPQSFAPITLTHDEQSICLVTGTVHLENKDKGLELTLEISGDSEKGYGIKGIERKSAAVTHLAPLHLTMARSAAILEEGAIIWELSDAQCASKLRWQVTGWIVP
jgi:hypothetical protein